MLDNLQMVKQVLEKCDEKTHYPLIKQLLMKINRNIARIEKEFNSSDETSIVELLHEEIHPMLRHLSERYPSLVAPITLYFNQLDEELGIVYRKRKAFEESVSMVNQSISAYLEQGEKDLQQILPHYFEKYQTDGVEFEM